MSWYDVRLTDDQLTVFTLCLPTFSFCQSTQYCRSDYSTKSSLRLTRTDRRRLHLLRGADRRAGRAALSSSSFLTTTLEFGNPTSP